MIISVLVKPRSKRPGVEIAADGILVVKVAAQPVDGKANEAVIKSLSATLGIPRSCIRLATGAKNKTKRFEIPDGTDIPTLSKNQI
jgi:uncharacterized protein YggU (UPF0235/DUF167 family)